MLAGLCFAAKADSPNLLEMYGYNPHFDDGIAPWKTGTGATIEQCDEDSADDDGYCAKITSRSQVNFANLRLEGENALSIFREQGAGTYYYSFWVKCAKKGASIKLSPVFQLVYGGKWSSDASASGEVIGKWPGDPGAKGFEVTDEWTKIEIEIEVATSINGKDLYEAIIYSIQRDHNSGANAPDLLFDDVTLIKRGDYVEVTPLPEVTIPSQTRVENVERSEKTGIGAINYHMWFETLENWWQYDNAYAFSKDRNSVQEARGLSPAKYHFHLPFWAEINTAITQSNYIVGDISKGVAEFPEYTKEIWTREMEYAIESGIDFMAYLWNSKRRPGEWSYKYHIETKGLDGKLKMAAILQSETQDLDTMANAMCEDYWYTIDGMPVVYIFGGSSAASDELISKIRTSLAQAQYEKFGKVGKPAYIIVMGVNNYSEAVSNASRGLDATGWYAFSATSGSVKNVKTAAGKNIKQYTYSSLTSNAISTMKSVSKVATNGYMGVSPLITLGWDTSPRVDNPVSWTSTPENSKVVARPTASEITQATLDVLNWNKTNKNVFKCNTVLFYAWNEFTEGGWICPTAQIDENGNIVKNPDGTTKVNRTHLDAVKAAIKSYRQANNEVFNVTVDVGKDEPTTTPTPTVNTDFVGDEEQTTVTPTPTQLPDNSDITEPTALATATSKPEATNKPNATKAPAVTEIPEIHQENKSDLTWLWISVGAVALAGCVVAAVIIIKKKKSAKQ